MQVGVFFYCNVRRTCTPHNNPTVHRSGSPISVVVKFHTVHVLHKASQFEKATNMFDKCWGAI